jgi:chromosomal replication initiation ATPase DnaA
MFIILEVAYDFCEVWLKDNYLGLLKDVITHAAGQPMQVKFRVGTAVLTPPTAVVCGQFRSRQSQSQTQSRYFSKHSGPRIRL